MSKLICSSLCLGQDCQLSQEAWELLCSRGSQTTAFNESLPSATMKPIARMEAVELEKSARESRRMA